MLQECLELKVKILDQSNQEIILEIKLSLAEMNELRITMKNLGTEHSKITENLRELQASHSNLKTEHSKVLDNLKELQDSQCIVKADHFKVTEILKDPILWNIRGSPFCWKKMVD